MEYLQYFTGRTGTIAGGYSFKPYYKWNTFNTLTKSGMPAMWESGF